MTSFDWKILTHCVHATGTKLRIINIPRRDTKLHLIYCLMFKGEIEVRSNNDMVNNDMVKDLTMTCFKNKPFHETVL